MNTIIYNNLIKLCVDLHGGSMTSIIDKRNEEELLYQVDERSWHGQDVVIFPFVARLKDKSYKYKGNEYHLENHGLARYNDFEIAEKNKDSVTLLFKSNEETLKQYPFEFELYVTYRLIETKIDISYKVINKSENTMFFGIGGHPALKVNAVELEDRTNISGNKIYFDKEIDQVQYTLNEQGTFIDGPISHEEGLVGFELSKELINKHKTLILDGVQISKVFLKKKDGRIITVGTNNSNFIAFWTHPTFGDYFCIEPWQSLPDFVDAPKDITKKQTLLQLESNKTYEFSYSIDIGELK